MDRDKFISRELYKTSDSRKRQSRSHKARTPKENRGRNQSQSCQGIVLAFELIGFA